MSTAIGIRFPGGRYHATPWDRHVNEADVEWPPSSLRILRALIAVWHRKADRELLGEDRLRALVHGLAGEPPVYRLPRAVLSHTRHYMPIRSGGGEKPTLVFDAFLSIDPDDELLVIWPETTLGHSEIELLDHLLERMGYLGRAESWAEARRLDEWSMLPDCGPESSVGRWSASAAGPMEPVAVPVPMTPEEYARWRADRIIDLGLERPRRAGERRLRATLPDELVDALRLDTGEVRRAGWSRMPGTREMTYQRPAHAMAPTPVVRPGRDLGAGVDSTTARLALIRAPRALGDLARSSEAPLPLLQDAVRMGEVCRAAAMSRADEVPPVLSGHDLPGSGAHQHAFYLPEDADGDGRIDHVLVHAAAGLGVDALRALGRIDRLWFADGAEWRVLLEGYGVTSDFPSHPYLTAATVWESVTPYLHPWFRKRSFSVEDQIRRELGERGLPAPAIERLASVRVGPVDRRPVHFHRFRSRRGLTQPDTQGSLWRLVFPEPVQGPIALGFACHYGLGIFRGIGGP